MSDESQTPMQQESEDDQDALARQVEQAIKNSLQELLRSGVLEVERKPNLYRTALTSQQQINAILQPLDLQLKIDDIRGIAFIVIAEDYAEGERDEWSHPLVRRQRLNLEQSLLVAILRRYYLAHERDSGIGATAATLNVDDLLPELNQFLGATGSDSKDNNRLRQQLAKLREHGLVSEIDANDQLTIRPLIVHIANPKNLQNLLAAFREQTS